MKTIIVGFDAFDPVIFEKLHAEGKMPNLGKLADSGGYARFGVTNPPQSEVSWTSIATGMNPGGHGIFDFVHRNPNNYGRDVSLLPTKTSVLGRQFTPPHSAPTIFDVAVEDGYPAVSLWWPATFPARQASPVWSIPGLGAPDIFGRLGVGLFYSMDPGEGTKTRQEQLTQKSPSHYLGFLEGPSQMTLTGPKDASLPFEIKVSDENSLQFIIAKQSYSLPVGEWSPIIELTFKVGFGVSIKAVTRVIVNQLSPAPIVYFLPLQLHPLRAPWPYGTPKRFLKKIWKSPGPYLTLGWPQDTTGLEEGFISDDQFLTLCAQIRAHREKTMLTMIASYHEGVLGCVFDSMDRVQHMFLRDRKDVIEDWYIHLDGIYGRIQNKIQSKPAGKDIHLMMVSDHGFGEFNHKVSINRWMVNHKYLTPTHNNDSGNLNDVEWAESKAYAIGLNSLYLNLAGREGQGSVSLEQKDEVLTQLSAKLLEWKGPDGNPVVQKVIPRPEAFDGPLSEYGPDLVIGYRSGYRASAETGLGEWGTDETEPNQDHWGADHCFDADCVPGVLFSNRGLGNFPNPTYRDIPNLAIQKSITPREDAAVPEYSDEDQDAVEERLKELGYL
jgi:predicted AlkP superfamily phosphohydrolase/phosphomutase